MAKTNTKNHIIVFRERRESFCQKDFFNIGKVFCDPKIREQDGTVVLGGGGGGGEGRGGESWQAK
jgi:hypothetical protein